jgi:hypothetical protein
MVTCSDEKWPIVYIHVDGAPTLEDLHIYLNYCDKWLSREEPFGVVYNQTNAEIAEKNESKEVHKLENEWKNQNKSRFTQYCFGIACVVDSIKLLQKSQIIVAKSIPNTFGCPGMAFGTIAEAEKWLETKDTQFNGKL